MNKQMIYLLDHLQFRIWSGNWITKQHIFPSGFTLREVSPQI